MTPREFVHLLSPLGTSLIHLAAACSSGLQLTLQQVLFSLASAYSTGTQYKAEYSRLTRASRLQASKVNHAFAFWTPFFLYTVLVCCCRTAFTANCIFREKNMSELQIEDYFIALETHTPTPLPCFEASKWLF